MPPLKNSQHELFAKLFVAPGPDQGNATECAKKSGFKEKSAHSQGYRIKNRPDVRARIVELQAIRSEKCDLDARLWTKNVMDKLDKPDISDSDYLRGYDMLAKSLGIYSETRINRNQQDNRNFRVASMDGEELVVGGIDHRKADPKLLEAGEEQDEPTTNVGQEAVN